MPAPLFLLCKNKNKNKNKKITISPARAFVPTPGPCGHRAPITHFLPAHVFSPVPSPRGYRLPITILLGGGARFVRKRSGGGSVGGRGGRDQGWLRWAVWLFALFAGIVVAGDGGATPCHLNADISRGCVVATEKEYDWYCWGPAGSPDIPECHGNFFIARGTPFKDELVVYTCPPFVTWAAAERWLDEVKNEWCGLDGLPLADASADVGTIRDIEELMSTRGKRAAAKSSRVPNGCWQVLGNDAWYCKRTSITNAVLTAARVGAEMVGHSVWKVADMSADALERWAKALIGGGSQPHWAHGKRLAKLANAFTPGVGVVLADIAGEAETLVNVQNTSQRIASDALFDSALSRPIAQAYGEVKQRNAAANELTRRVDTKMAELRGLRHDIQRFGEDSADLIMVLDKAREAMDEADKLVAELNKVTSVKRIQLERRANDALGTGCRLEDELIATRDIVRRAEVGGDITTWRTPVEIAHLEPCAQWNSNETQCSQAAPPVRLVGSNVQCDGGFSVESNGSVVAVVSPAGNAVAPTNRCCRFNHADGTTAAAGYKCGPVKVGSSGRGIAYTGKVVGMTADLAAVIGQATRELPNGQNGTAAACRVIYADGLGTDSDYSCSVVAHGKWTGAPVTRYDGKRHDTVGKLCQKGLADSRAPNATMKRLPSGKEIQVLVACVPAIGEVERTVVPHLTREGRYIGFGEKWAHGFWRVARAVAAVMLIGATNALYGPRAGIVVGVLAILSSQYAFAHECSAAGYVFDAQLELADGVRRDYSYEGFARAGTCLKLEHEQIVVESVSVRVDYSWVGLAHLEFGWQCTTDVGCTLGEGEAVCHRPTITTARIQRCWNEERGIGREPCYYPGAVWVVTDCVAADVPIAEMPNQGYIWSLTEGIHAPVMRLCVGGTEQCCETDGAGKCKLGSTEIIVSSLIPVDMQRPAMIVRGMKQWFAARDRFEHSALCIAPNVSEPWDFFDDGCVARQVDSTTGAHELKLAQAQLTRFIGQQLQPIENLVGDTLVIVQPNDTTIIVAAQVGQTQVKMTASSRITTPANVCNNATVVVGKIEAGLEHELAIGRVNITFGGTSNCQVQLHSGTCDLLGPMRVLIGSEATVAEIRFLCAATWATTLALVTPNGKVDIPLAGAARQVDYHLAKKWRKIESKIASWTSNSTIAGWLRSLHLPSWPDVSGWITDAALLLLAAAAVSAGMWPVGVAFALAVMAKHMALASASDLPIKALGTAWKTVVMGLDAAVANTAVHESVFTRWLEACIACLGAVAAGNNISGAVVAFVVIWWALCNVRDVPHLMWRVYASTLGLSMVGGDRASHVALAVHRAMRLRTDGFATVRGRRDTWPARTTSGRSKLASVIGQSAMMVSVGALVATAWCFDCGTEVVVVILMAAATVTAIKALALFADRPIFTSKGGELVGQDAVEALNAIAVDADNVPFNGAYVSRRDGYYITAQHVLDNAGVTFPQLWSTTDMAIGAIWESEDGEARRIPDAVAWMTRRPYVGTVSSNFAVHNGKKVVSKASRLGFVLLSEGRKLSGREAQGLSGFIWKFNNGTPRGHEIVQTAVNRVSGIMAEPFGMITHFIRVGNKIKAEQAPVDALPSKALGVDSTSDEEVARRHLGDRVFDAEGYELVKPRRVWRKIGLIGRRAILDAMKHDEVNGALEYVRKAWANNRGRRFTPVPSTSSESDGGPKKPASAPGPKGKLAGEPSKRKVWLTYGKDIAKGLSHADWVSLLADLKKTKHAPKFEPRQWYGSMYDWKADGASSTSESEAEKPTTSARARAGDWRRRAQRKKGGTPKVKSVPSGSDVERKCGTPIETEKWKRVARERTRQSTNIMKSGDLLPLSAEEDLAAVVGACMRPLWEAMPPEKRQQLLQPVKGLTEQERVDANRFRELARASPRSRRSPGHWPEPPFWAVIGAQAAAAYIREPRLQEPPDYVVDSVSEWELDSVDTASLRHRLVTEWQAKQRAVTPRSSLSGGEVIGPILAPESDSDSSVHEWANSTASSDRSAEAVTAAVDDKLREIGVAEAKIRALMAELHALRSSASTSGTEVTNPTETTSREFERQRRNKKARCGVTRPCARVAKVCATFPAADMAGASRESGSGERRGNKPVEPRRQEVASGAAATADQHDKIVAAALAGGERRPNKRGVVAVQKAKEKGVWDNVFNFSKVEEHTRAQIRWKQGRPEAPRGCIWLKARGQSYLVRSKLPSQGSDDGSFGGTSSRVSIEEREYRTFLELQEELRRDNPDQEFLRQADKLEKELDRNAAHARAVAGQPDVARERRKARHDMVTEMAKQRRRDRLDREHEEYWAQYAHHPATSQRVWVRSDLGARPSGNEQSCSSRGNQSERSQGSQDVRIRRHAGPGDEGQDPIEFWQRWQREPKHDFAEHRLATDGVNATVAQCPAGLIAPRHVAETFGLPVGDAIGEDLVLVGGPKRPTWTDSDVEETNIGPFIPASSQWAAGYLYPFPKRSSGWNEQRALAGHDIRPLLGKAEAKAPVRVGAAQDALDGMSGRIVTVNWVRCGQLVESDFIVTESEADPQGTTCRLLAAGRLKAEEWPTDADKTPLMRSKLRDIECDIMQWKLQERSSILPSWIIMLASQLRLEVACVETDSRLEEMLWQQSRKELAEGNIRFSAKYWIALHAMALGLGGQQSSFADEQRTVCWVRLNLSSIWHRISGTERRVSVAEGLRRLFGSGSLALDVALNTQANLPTMERVRAVALRQLRDCAQAGGVATFCKLRTAQVGMPVDLVASSTIHPGFGLHAQGKALLLHYRVTANVGSRGWAVVRDGHLATNHHVVGDRTLGLDVTLGNGDEARDISVRWAPAQTNRDPQGDVVTTGNWHYDAGQPGDVGFVLNPQMRKWRAFICLQADFELREHGEGRFAQWCPIEVTFGEDGLPEDFTMCATSSYWGMSGSPIVGVRGEVFGTYGVVARMADEGHQSNITRIDPIGATAALCWPELVASVVNVCQQEATAKTPLIVMGTGLGKSTRLVPMISLALQDFDTCRDVVLLQPHRATCRNTFERCASQFWPQLSERGISLEMKHGGAQGGKPVHLTRIAPNAKAKLTIMTYGMAAAAPVSWPKSLVVMDEIHFDDASVLLLRDLVRAEVIRPHTTIAMTATEPAGWDEWLELLGKKIAGVSMPIVDKTLTVMAHGDYWGHDRLVPMFWQKDGDKIGTRAMCGEGASVMCMERESLQTGNILVFVPTHRAAEQLAAEWNDHADQVGDRHAVFAYSGRLDSLATLSDEGNAVIFATDAISTGVTLPRIAVVVSCGVRFRPIARWDPKDRAEESWYWTVQSGPITIQEMRQQRGRTGRTCAGTHYAAPMVYGEHADTDAAEFEAMWKMIIANQDGWAFKENANAWKNWDASPVTRRYHDFLVGALDRPGDRSGETFPVIPQLRNKTRWLSECGFDALGLSHATEIPIVLWLHIVGQQDTNDWVEAGKKVDKANFVSRLSTGRFGLFKTQAALKRFAEHCVWSPTASEAARAALRLPSGINLREGGAGTIGWFITDRQLTSVHWSEITIERIEPGRGHTGVANQLLSEAHYLASARFDLRSAKKELEGMDEPTYGSPRILTKVKSEKQSCLELPDINMGAGTAVVAGVIAAYAVANYLLTPKEILPHDVYEVELAAAAGEAMAQWKQMPQWRSYTMIDRSVGGVIQQMMADTATSVFGSMPLINQLAQWVDRFRSNCSTERQSSSIVQDVIEWISRNVAWLWSEVRELIAEVYHKIQQVGVCDWIAANIPAIGGCAVAGGLGAMLNAMWDQSPVFCVLTCVGVSMLAKAAASLSWQVSSALALGWAIESCWRMCKNWASERNETEGAAKWASGKSTVPVDRAEKMPIYGAGAGLTIVLSRLMNETVAARAFNKATDLPMVRNAALAPVSTSDGSAATLALTILQAYRLSQVKTWGQAEGLRAVGMAVQAYNALSCGNVFSLLAGMTVVGVLYSYSAHAKKEGKDKAVSYGTNLKAASHEMVDEKMRSEGDNVERHVQKAVEIACIALGIYTCPYTAVVMAMSAGLEYLRRQFGQSEGSKSYLTICADSTGTGLFFSALQLAVNAVSLLQKKTKTAPTERQAGVPELIESIFGALKGLGTLARTLFEWLAGLARTLSSWFGGKALSAVDAVVDTFADSARRRFGVLGWLIPSSRPVTEEQLQPAVTSIDYEEIGAESELDVDTERWLTDESLATLKQLRMPAIICVASPLVPAMEGQQWCAAGVLDLRGVTEGVEIGRPWSEVAFDWASSGAVMERVRSFDDQRVKSPCQYAVVIVGHPACGDAIQRTHNIWQPFDVIVEGFAVCLMGGEFHVEMDQRQRGLLKPIAIALQGRTDIVGQRPGMAMFGGDAGWVGVVDEMKRCGKLPSRWPTSPAAASDLCDVAWFLEPNGVDVQKQQDGYLDFWRAVVGETIGQLGMFNTQKPTPKHRVVDIIQHQPMDVAEVLRKARQIADANEVSHPVAEAVGTDSQWIVGGVVAVLGPHKGVYYHNNDSGNHDTPEITDETIDTATVRLRRFWDPKLDAKVRDVGRVLMPSELVGNGYKPACAKFHLMDINTSFARDRHVIWDLTAGTGGFLQYLSMLYNTAKVEVYYHAMVGVGRATPNVEVPASLGTGARFHALLPQSWRESGVTDLRDQRCLTAINSQATKERPDLIVCDAGEWMMLSTQEAKWYLRGTPNLINSVGKIVRNLAPGGRLLIKFMGMSCSLCDAIQANLDCFTRYKVIFAGTTVIGSREWYLLCEGFGENAHTNLGALMRQVRWALWQRLNAAFGQWASAERRGGVRGTPFPDPGPYGRAANHGGELVSPASHPARRTYINSEGVKFDPEVDKRLQLVLSEWRTNVDGRIRLDSGACYVFEKVLHLGMVDKRVRGGQQHHFVNELASLVLKDGFGWTMAGSAVGHTDISPASMMESHKKRLDLLPSDPPVEAQTLLIKVRDNIYTPGGRESHGRFRPALLGDGRIDFDRVWGWCNPKGAGGRFDADGKIKELISTREGRDRCQRAFDSLVRGECGPTYFTSREKKETKGVKDVDAEGRLLPEACAQVQKSGEARPGLSVTPRQIQFADGPSRVCDLVLFGEMLYHDSKVCRLTYGKIPGVPLPVMATAIRGAWDEYVPQQWREVGPEDDAFDPMTQMMRARVRPLEGAGNFPVAGASGDFSKWDGTVSRFDLLSLEMEVVKCLSAPEWHETIHNRYRHFTWGITVTDNNAVFVRMGQRASGDQFTSFGNTLLNSIYQFAATAEALGISAEEVCQPISHLDFMFKGVKKTAWLHRVTHFCDGDDNLHIGFAPDIEAMASSAPTFMTRCGKVIHAEGKEGYAVTQTFENLSFCSHSFIRCVVGPSNRTTERWVLQNASRKRLNELLTPADRLTYMPYRSLAVIFGKMGATMKIWSVAGIAKTDEQKSLAMSITRGKALSYLLQYAHIRRVQLAALAILALTGTGECVFERGGVINPREWLEADTTPQGALESVYGVRSLEDIQLMPVELEARLYEPVRYNAKVCGESTTRTVDQAVLALQRLRIYKGKGKDMSLHEEEVFSLSPHIYAAWFKATWLVMGALGVDHGEDARKIRASFEELRNKPWRERSAAVNSIIRQSTYNIPQWTEPESSAPKSAATLSEIHPLTLFHAPPLMSCAPNVVRVIVMPWTSHYTWVSAHMERLVFDPSTAWRHTVQPMWPGVGKADNQLYMDTQAGAVFRRAFAEWASERRSLLAGAGSRALLVPDIDCLRGLMSSQLQPILVATVDEPEGGDEWLSHRLAAANAVFAGSQRVEGVINLNNVLHDRPTAERRLANTITQSGRADVRVGAVVMGCRSAKDAEMIGLATRDCSMTWRETCTGGILCRWIYQRRMCEPAGPTLLLCPTRHDALAAGLPVCGVVDQLEPHEAIKHVRKSALALSEGSKGVTVKHLVARWT
ncbi:polyprotein [Soybean cyst nematode virus 5]|uniref:polyprotein n=1 Tax=Soybean cyst nematode virus 5 TaxID=1495316 RepID=UPI0004589027|nr:polyprotein [Soybean cyst nematode virus 5]AHY79970.1 polyprotein [Soybean cyst nematode virus 5]